MNFVPNSNCAETSCAHSIALGSRDLTEPYLIIDGELLLVPDSFQDFVSECEKTDQPLVGVTPAKTDRLFLPRRTKREPFAVSRVRQDPNGNGAA